ncbi:uncharacterized protein IL334_003919 [Kwoniella shivajii]|uniref:Uncharacterized protein n=1 Tax=Kwoniella shivajii TaxID=564305 RepID=A0ABZ1CYY2_9TREE|nr:hypothetical protein IL334_003919 [Kwoniella shivajii]
MSLWQSAPMHWQTYTTSAPLTPQLEESFRRQAASAFAHSNQTMGYSVSSSFTTHNGITTGSTQLQVGKSTPWSPAEIDSVERYLVGLIPPGQLIGPSGRPVGYIGFPSEQATPSRMKKAKNHTKAPSITSHSSTISEAGTVPPSKLPISPISPVHSTHVHYEDHDQSQSGSSLRTFTRKFSKKRST